MSAATGPKPGKEHAKIKTEHDRLAAGIDADMVSGASWADAAMASNEAPDTMAAQFVDALLSEQVTPWQITGFVGRLIEHAREGR